MVRSGRLSYNILCAAKYNRGHTFIFHKAIVTPVLQLAVGLLGDLGLKKQPSDKQTCMMLEYDARGCPRPCDLGVRTLEEKRAAIACFSISQLYVTCTFTSGNVIKLTVQDFRHICRRPIRCAGFLVSTSILICLPKLETQGIACSCRL